MVKTSSRWWPSPGSVVPTVTPRTPGSWRIRSDQLLVEGDDLLAGFIASARKIDLHREDVMGRAANIDGTEPGVGFEEQAGRGEQDDGETDLKAKEHTPQDVRPAWPPL